MRKSTGYTCHTSPLAMRGNQSFQINVRVREKSQGLHRQGPEPSCLCSHIWLCVTQSPTQSPQIHTVLLSCTPTTRHKITPCVTTPSLPFPHGAPQLQYPRRLSHTAHYTSTKSGIPGHTVTRAYPLQGTQSQVTPNHSVTHGHTWTIIPRGLTAL